MSRFGPLDDPTAMDSVRYRSEEDLVPVLRLGIDRDVRAGVAPPEEIFRRGLALYADPPDVDPLAPGVRALLPDLVRREVRLAIERHVREQESWGVTDCDRLDRAFAELERAGIACFAGADVIPYRLAGGDERDWFEQELRRRSPGPWRAYVYWDQGHAWRCLETGSFGLPSRITASQGVPPGQPYRDRARELDAEVARALERCGVRFHFGTGGLYVQMRWQRRRPRTDLLW